MNLDEAFQKMLNTRLWYSTTAFHAQRLTASRKDLKTSNYLMNQKDSTFYVVDGQSKKYGKNHRKIYHLNDTFFHKNT